MTTDYADFTDSFICVICAICGFPSLGAAGGGAAVCAVFGAGAQAQQQLVAVHHVRPLRKAYVLDTNADARAAFARDLGEQLGIDVEAVDDAEAAVRGAAAGSRTLAVRTVWRWVRETP